MSAHKQRCPQQTALQPRHTPADLVETPQRPQGGRSPSCLGSTALCQTLSRWPTSNHVGESGPKFMGFTGSIYSRCSQLLRATGPHRRAQHESLISLRLRPDAPPPHQALLIKILCKPVKNIRKRIQKDDVTSERTKYSGFGKSNSRRRRELHKTMKKALSMKIQR